MSKAELSTQIMVRVSAETLASLQAASDAEERTVAQTVRLAIRRYLDADREVDR